MVTKAALKRERKKFFKNKLLDPELDTHLRKFHQDARDAFNAQPMEKKEKSLQAPTFIIYPFEVKYNQGKSLEEKEADSLELIMNHLETFETVFVSTSHGMDSVILCHLVLRAWKALKEKGIIRPKPEFWLNNTLNIYKEERPYWDMINKFLDIEDTFNEFKPPTDDDGKQYTVWSIAEEVGHLPSFRGMKGTGAAYQKTFGDKEKKVIGSKGDTPECCDILKKESIKKHLKDTFQKFLEEGTSKKYDCHFVGTRAEESRARKMGVMQRCRSYTIKNNWPYPIRACTPLSYWLFKDISDYYEKYGIPKNPTYAIHRMERMGCASCPAHKNWEIRIAQDPTEEGFGMLKMNFKILQKTEPERLAESLKTLQRWLKKKTTKYDISDKQREKIIALIAEFGGNEYITPFLKK